MDQATFDFATRPAAATTDRCGFEIGWDHACYGLVPPPALLAEHTAAQSPVAQGWQAARAVFGRRSRGSTPALRQWLALRLQAWQQGRPFDRTAFDAADLARLAVRRCPVLRRALGGAPQDPFAAAHLCLDPVRSHGIGRTVMLSRAAVQAAAGLGVSALLQRAREAAGREHAPVGASGSAAAAIPHACHAAGAGAGAAGGEGVSGLDAAAWRRLALLRSFATPLPFAVAAGLPLVLLPPPGVAPCNPVQALQALLTLQFATPGWAGRLRRLAATLGDPAQRQDLHLLVGALAPRVLEADAASGRRESQPTLREGLEDAWLHERVLRRWQTWVLGLGEAATLTMLQRLQQIGVREVMPRAPLHQPRHAQPARPEPTAGSNPAEGPIGAPGFEAATARRPVRPARPARPSRGGLVRPPLPSRPPGPGAGMPQT